MISFLLNLPVFLSRHLPKLKYSVWTTAEYLWYPLIAIASTPLILKGLGAEKYGLWILFVTTVSFGSVLNIGTGAATITQISAELGNSRNQQIEKVLRGALAVALLGGGALALIVTLIFLAASDSLFDKMGDTHIVMVTGVAAALIAWIEQIDNVYASALKGAEKFGLAARVEMVAKSGQMLSAIVTVMIGGDLSALYIVYGLATIARLILKMTVTKSYFRIRSLWPDFHEANKTLDYSKWGWIQGVGGMVFGLADRFIVGSMLGAASLAHYSVVMQLAAPIHAVTSAALSVVFPIVSRKHSGEEEGFSLHRIALLTLVANFVISTIPALIILFFGELILKIWLGTEYALSIKEVLWYLTIAYWLLALNITPYYILLGIGKIRIISLIVVVSGGIGLLPLYLGSLWFGLTGAAAGKIIFSTISLVLFIPLYKEIYKK